MRTPRRGRSKSICVPTEQADNVRSRFSKLNGYNKGLKKYKQPLSMVNPLESIVEGQHSMETEQQKLKMTIEQAASRNRSGSVEHNQVIPDPSLSKKQPTKKTISSKEIEQLQITPQP